jgi:PAS domain S-box-containing protein
VSGTTSYNAWMGEPGIPRALILACGVAGLSYSAAQLGATLVLRPQMLWPVWPGCALLVAILLLAPKKLWPLILAAGLLGFSLYDFATGLPVRAILLLIVSDAVEVLIAALGIGWFFDGLPRLTSLKSFAQYSLVAVVLAPIPAAFLGALSFSGAFWFRWRVSFLTEALALLTLTPAVLGWVGMAWSKKPPRYYLEATVLLAGVMFFGHITFDSTSSSNLPVLLYAILPFLLWAALRFGTVGIVTCMILVEFLSVRGAVHGLGPFAGADPRENLWYLQLFLLLAAATFMVLATVVEEHKLTVKALHEGEQRFRLVANTVPSMIWMSGPDRLRNYFNQPWLEFTGQPLEAELTNGWSKRVHPDDLPGYAEVYARAFDKREPFKMQYRLRRRDGEYRWVFDIGVPRFDAGSECSFVGYIGSCIDITDRKIAEEALSAVGGRLIEAHDQERTCIAKELHDDINQRIALLAIELEQLKRNLPASAVVPHTHLREVRHHVSDLSTDIHALSHRLHSSTLEYLGVAAAMDSFCKEFSEQNQVEIDFRHATVPRNVPKEASLCLFRVLQEAMQNAVRHSGVRHFKVNLRGTSDEIRLTVSDSGSGFDPLVAIAGRGCGLISMQERVRRVNGEFRIDSRAGRGTTVFARVPVRTKVKPQDNEVNVGASRS